jgi:hypothetical protein
MMLGKFCVDTYSGYIYDKAGRISFLPCILIAFIDKNKQKWLRAC